MKVYLKMRNKSWMLIVKKIEQVSFSRKKHASRYILAGGRADPPKMSKDFTAIEVPANIVNKFISKLLDVGGDDEIALIEPSSADRYVVKTSKKVKRALDEILASIASGSSRDHKEIKTS
ncbi:MAG: hypothetical protein QXW94_01065 [Desulfurococcaceae archaeon]